MRNCVALIAAKEMHNDMWTMKTGIKLLVTIKINKMLIKSVLCSSTNYVSSQNFTSCIIMLIQWHN